jgi:hypothetical protein
MSPQRQGSQSSTSATFHFSRHSRHNILGEETYLSANLALIYLYMLVHSSQGKRSVHTI